MTKYGQYCPMARALELLGDRWTLLIVRDLILGAHHFNELERGLPGISRALLTGRLKRLQDEGIIERRAGANGQKVWYELTQAGRELYPIVESMTRWGAAWAFGEPRPEELDPVLLMWWIRDRVYTERLTQERVVVEFDFREARPRRFWLIMKPDDVSICVKHPGYEIDVLVTAGLSIFYQVWLGRIPFAQAIADDQITIDSTPALIQAFPNWFALSQVVGIADVIT
jgi:DNA-binding HxlR family transcriptional regulator